MLQPIISIVKNNSIAILPRYYYRKTDKIKPKHSADLYNE